MCSSFSSSSARFSSMRSVCASRSDRRCNCSSRCRSASFLASSSESAWFLSFRSTASPFSASRPRLISTSCSADFSRSDLTLISSRRVDMANSARMRSLSAWISASVSGTEASTRLRVSATARRQMAGATISARKPAQRKPRTKNRIDWTKVTIRYGWQAIAKAGFCHLRMTEIQRGGKSEPRPNTRRRRGRGSATPCRRRRP